MPAFLLSHAVSLFDAIPKGSAVRFSQENRLTLFLELLYRRA
ncbi:hypothetical protein [Mesorhizobium sp. M7A.F.Ca.US.011.01.1.1]|nr:hypothetical protein [Mesorhizobium sp. M7A.F.Ca.US.011.01.1.1]